MQQILSSVTLIVGKLKVFTPYGGTKVANQYTNETRYFNFREIINSSAERFPENRAFQIKVSDGIYKYISYAELRILYYGLCSKFIELGFQGKRIALNGLNSIEWCLCYLCAATVGVVVPLDKELQGEDINNFINDAECVALCTSADRIKEFSPSIEKNIAYIDFSKIFSLARENLDYEAVDSINIKKDETNIIIFTSGTTGNSKGVCLSQFNICSNIYQTVRMFRVYENDKTLSILPLHHTYECTLDFLLILTRGACISYCDGLTKIQKNLVEYSPSILVVVPALLKVLSRRISKTIANEVPEKYKNHFEALSLGDALEKIPFIIRKVITSKVKKSLGGNLRVFIVGAAELETSLVKDFQMLGIRTLQGYGLTECSPLLAGNGDFHFNPDSTGIAIPGVEIKIHDPNDENVGEIIARGDNIMLGYFNDDKATKEVIKEDWFYTGDLGYMDENGDLYIKGRIKNVIVTENGKNIYPEELESRLYRFPEISEVLILEVADNGKNCVKAKIFPNIEYLKEKFGKLPNDEDVRKSITSIIKSVNSKIPGYKRIRLVEVLSQALEKTTSQKIKRHGENLK